MFFAPPPEEDVAMVAYLRSLGIVAGEPLKWNSLSFVSKWALSWAKTLGTPSVWLAAYFQGRTVNEWQFLPVVGTYGVDYDARAALAIVGLGANLLDDGMYFSQNLDGGLLCPKAYKMHFKADELPPIDADGFWSITVYNFAGYLVPNAIQRYTLGSESGLMKNQDGSLTIYIQQQEPSEEKLQN